MSLRIVIVSALAGVAALASVSVVIGDSDSKLPSKAEAFVFEPAHEVAAPTQDVNARTVSRGGGATRIKYFETNSFGVSANGREDFFMRCPRRHGAINGYFGSDGGIVADYTASADNIRNWDFGLIDLTGSPGNAFAGIVCYKL